MLLLGYLKDFKILFQSFYISRSISHRTIQSAISVFTVLYHFLILTFTTSCNMHFQGSSCLLKKKRNWFNTPPFTIQTKLRMTCNYFLFLSSQQKQPSTTGNKHLFLTLLLFRLGPSKARQPPEPSGKTARHTEVLGP